ncbi:hypothetical protein AEGHOMDF_0639 [Methylobacterium soli]|nr:hypothetical protein AEGHOMDF_0639 [Methylobacterium soli]
MAGASPPALATARGALAWWLAEIGGLVGRAEARPDRAPAALTIRLGAPGAACGLSVTDRRAQSA